MLRRAPAAIAALALAACGGGAGDSRDGGPDDGDGSLPGDLVVADVMVTFVAEAATRALPANLSGLTIEAVVVGPGGETTRFPGTAADGRIEIEGVPQGRYMLRVGDRYFDTERRRLDLGFALLGRADAGVLGNHTPLRLLLDNLSPWTEDDRVELFAPNSGLVYPDPLAAATPPVAGATALDASVDLVLAEQARTVDGDTGDVLYVDQLAGRIDASGNRIRELARSLRTGETFAVVSGEPGELQGSLDAVTADRHLDVAWSGAPHADVAATMGPLGPAPALQGARLVATPVDPDLGVLASYPTLASVEVAATDDQTIGLDFGSPLPGQWSELEIDFIEVEAELVSGGFAARPRAVSVSLPGRLESGAAPALGPPTAVTIGGLDAGLPEAGVGSTPELQWEPPEVGVAGGYEVEIHQLPGGQRLATLVTTATSIRVPADLLEAAKSYFLELRAIAAPGSDLAAAPLRRSIPESLAETVTAPFSP